MVALCGGSSCQVDRNLVCTHLLINPVRPLWCPRHRGRAVDVSRYPLRQRRVAVMSRPVLGLQVVVDGVFKVGRVRPMGRLVAEALRDQLPQFPIDVVELLVQEVDPVGPHIYLPPPAVGVGDGNLFGELGCVGETKGNGAEHDLSVLKQIGSYVSLY